MRFSKFKFIYLLILLQNYFCIYSQSVENSKLIEFQAQKFKYILETVISNYPDSINITDISDKAFEALLQSIDKDSYYYNKQYLKQISEKNKGISYGIGIETVSIRDTIYAIQVFKNTPASEKSIGVGDIILAVDGKRTIGMSKKQVDELIQGDSATKVKLSVKEVISQKIVDYTLERRDIPNLSISTSFIFPNSDIGVIVMNRFSENSSIEFFEKSQLFISLGVKRIIIDVRNNPGGYMVKVDEILDLIISGNRLLTRTESTNPEYRSSVYSKDGDFLEQIPIVIIIDENSASGSELLAGVVQDYDRGIVVGKRSYGKGTIQKIWSMNDSTGFKLTVGKYLTPSGRDIQQSKQNESIIIDTGLDTKYEEELQSRISRMGGSSKIKIYKSTSGRPIIAGGGVTPDYIIESDTLTQLTNLLIRRGLYFEWAVNFKMKYGMDLLDKYKYDYSKFNLEFQINDDMLREFAKFALENNVWNKDMFDKDKTYFILYMKASIANTLWGYDAFNEVLSIVDKQLIGAIRALPEAEKMINK